MSEFAFQWLGALPLLLLTPPLALLLSYARAQRLQVIEAMGSARPKYRRLRDTLRLLAFVCLVLALARPGYAPHTESVSRTGRDVVFALDVSRSMLAQDVPPSRLEVAKQGIRDALERFKNERVGLILYAGSASILCPLTSDYGYVRFVLEQAHPRSVDFGGTTMQAAIQKAIDQVFMEGRENLQDLIILTDGEDNGSRLEATVQSLDERSVDTLLIGLGNPQRGSPIPIQNDEGQQIFLEQDGNTIYTQLDDDALHALAALSKRIQYRAVGTSPFNLGQVYQDYAKDLPIDSRYDENGIQIYHEAAPYFLITALVLLLLAEYWGARGIQFGQAAILLCALLVYKPSEATTSAFKDFYTQAFDSYQSGDYKTAEAQFAELYDHASKQNASPETLGSIQFNRGLCQIQLAQASAEDNPQTALIYAQNAKLDFLSAKRYRSDLNRAGIRLQTTALLIGEIEAKIEAQEKRNAELQAQMEALLEELKTLLVEQTKLREKLQATDPARFSNRKKMPERVIPEKETVTQQSSNFPKEQNILIEESRNIQEAMVAIEQQLNLPELELRDRDTFLTEPLQLLAIVKSSQTQSSQQLAIWEQWPAAHKTLQTIEQTIETIIELLSNDSDEFSEDSETEEFSEEDYDYAKDSEESMNSSEAMQGDLAAVSEMQALPNPNYTAEDILMEEKGNLQFRQQKRAEANAGKVEKDY